MRSRMLKVAACATLSIGALTGGGCSINFPSMGSTVPGVLGTQGVPTANTSGVNLGGIPLPGSVAAGLPGTPGAVGGDFAAGGAGGAGGVSNGGLVPGLPGTPGAIGGDFAPGGASGGN
jgi:hypothetical protein